MVYMDDHLWLFSIKSIREWDSPLNYENRVVAFFLL